MFHCLCTLQRWTELNFRFYIHLSSIEGFKEALATFSGNTCLFYTDHPELGHSFRSPVIFRLGFFSMQIFTSILCVFCRECSVLISICINLFTSQSNGRHHQFQSSFTGSEFCTIPDRLDFVSEVSKLTEDK